MVCTVYVLSETKGADQLRGYRATDLHLWLLLLQGAGFLMIRFICHNFQLKSEVSSCVVNVGKGGWCTVHGDLMLTWFLHSTESKRSLPTHVVAPCFLKAMGLETVWW